MSPYTKTDKTRKGSVASKKGSAANSNNPSKPQAHIPDYSLERLRCLRAQMRALELDAVISLDPDNLRWLSAWQGVFDSEPAHMALVTKNKAYIHTDSRYVDAMAAKNKSGQWRVDASPRSHASYLHDILAKSRKQNLRVGYEASLRLDQFKALKKALAPLKPKLVETKGLFVELRAIKDDEEVRLLRKAQSFTDKAFADLLTWITPGMSELEVANRLEFVMKDLGAEGVAFATIAASGPNSALPHARPSTRKLRKGDFLVLDFGACYRDYCADMSRTLVIGKASERQRIQYEAVLDAHTAAKKGIKAGITGKEAHELARDVLKAQGFEKGFTHALGHGVGIAVHEYPSLSPYNDKPLVAGNIVTVEPGVYVTGYGGVRIEDYGLVTESGFTSFTKSPHELIEIAAD